MTESESSDNYNLSESENSPHLIPQEELINNAEQDFESLIEEGSFNRKDIDEFIREKVRAVHLNGANIICIDFDHEENNINPIAEAYIRSPNTKVVVVEYFYPELESREGLIPLIERISGHKDRIVFAKKLSDLCKDARKPVAVADIANKPLYEVSRLIFRAFPMLSNAFLHISNIYPELSRQLFVPVNVANIGWAIGLLISLIKEKGIFDKEKIGILDEFILDFEQARRFYVARGVEQLTKEYVSVEKKDEETPQIVVMYPKAHGIRIANNLVKQTSQLDRARNIIYRLFGTGLDFTVRLWSWKSTLSRLSSSSDDENSNNLSNWTRFSNRKITL